MEHVLSLEPDDARWLDLLADPRLTKPVPLRTRAGAEVGVRVLTPGWVTAA